MEPGRQLRSREPVVQLRAPGPARAGGRVAPAPTSDRHLFPALLPLRFFVGATFLYAGIDKLIDPRFLNATGPGSIGEQLTGFTHASPLGGPRLGVRAALPGPRSAS